MTILNKCVIIGALVILFDWKASVEGIWTCNKGINTKDIKREFPRISGKDIKTCKEADQDCSAISDCCSGTCPPIGKCDCNRVRETCEVDTDCCSLVCLDGEKKCGYKQLEDSCLLSKQCHPGFCTRFEENTGFKKCTVCRQGGEDCEPGNNSGCCNGCVDGKCSLSRVGGVCTHDSHCEPKSNFAGQNAAVTCDNNRCECFSANLKCQTNDDCCISEKCNNSTNLCE